MSIRVAINHHTEYRYDRAVKLSPHVFRLRPAPHSRTPITSYSLKLSPDKHFLNWQQDPFGNFLARVVFPDKTRALHIDVDLVAEMTAINPFDFFIEEYAEHYPFTYPEQLAKELAPYFEIRERGPLLTKWLEQIDPSKRSTIDFVVELNQRLQHDIGYLIRLEPGIQTCEQTLDKCSGSCRDTGWLLVQILRHLGIAARFVSGYLVQLVADVKALDGPSGPTQDFTDLHAWAEAYIPGAGWVGLDPTSGLFAGEGHIPLAATPDPASAAPVTGGLEECKVEFAYHNQVTRIHEDPRVTRPYTGAQWTAVYALGQQVDQELARDDVRLTLGGEPTFVSIDDMDGAQWNTAALGEHKRRLAGDLFHRLRECFAPGGVPHFGQGKWYPGEPLPRWALTCFWRTDGQPLWQHSQYLAEDGRDYHHGVDEAERFVRRLARQLKLGQSRIIPAFEDYLYYLWREGQVPDNLDPNKADLKDPLERRRLARLLQRGLDAPIGYVLPVVYDEGWISSSWPLRRERLFLVPGDSPMGLRLPLESLPWVRPEEREPEFGVDPFAPRGPLILPVAPSAQSPQDEPDIADRDAGKILHTALCVEPRDGRVHVFMPPLEALEHYIELLAAIEQVATESGLPVTLEGYEPPRDPRLRHFQITPDPGVIEVNIHPATNWEQLVHTTQILYEQARLARLGTEKFMLDGRHTGTGGGNHVTLGAADPVDSPLLRRPQLLRSLVNYWQHHPALSYLFSGAFIGPTSQAPRVDEARDDNLYELEIAFARLPEGDCDRPWLVDRVLRNLLVDVTGNTHRAEFCIDKLYSPDSPVGRRGLLEFRAFEMPPHWQMSLVQMLLLRALVARFWRTPYRHQLIRWGTELHDRFMLPHYVAADLRDVIDDLRGAGYEFALDWFAPFLEFRFPVFGRVNVGEIELELRFALEPWHVLGEEVAAQGTARYVDSSVERLQVKVTGFVPERFMVACNGRRVPLRSTSRPDEFVAGIRYKAWQPASGLHPTIGVHAPLVFDVIDIFNQRAVGGCTYHVGHPGGRNYETFPVNALEAEGRRRARFWDHGHTPGPIIVPGDEPAGDHPYTLDLRYPARRPDS